jgi:hypothetical protein
MEGIMPFVSILFIVFGILQIILFFKLWGMTDDVRKLRNDCLRSGYGFDFENEVRKLILLGDKEKAKELILNKFIEKLINGNSFQDLKEQLGRDLEKIGEEMPDGIKKLESLGDFSEMF